MTGMVLNMQAQGRIADLEEDDDKVAADEDAVSEDEAFLTKDLPVRGDKIIGKDDTPVVLVLSDELADGSVRIWLNSIGAGAMNGCDDTASVAQNDYNELKVIVDWERVKEWYEEYLDKVGNEEIKIEGIDANRVVDVKIAEYGHITGDNEMLLFLMDDGTVQYVWLAGAIRDNDWTPKKLEDVEGVIALRKIGISETGCSGAPTMFAQKANGELYDLYPMFVAQGVWD